MPLSRSQAENFVAEFFKDHRLVAPLIRTRRRFVVTLVRRKCLNLPRIITRSALADQVAARLCRDCVKRMRHDQIKRPRLAIHLTEWQRYVRGVVVNHFGAGDGLQ